VFLTDLKVVDLQPHQLGAPEAASDQNCQNSSIPLSSKRIQAWCAQQRTALICCQPVPNPRSQSFGTLHSSYPRREFRAQEAGIRRLIGKPPNGGQPNVDRRRGQILLLQEEPISKHYRSIERQAWFRAVPPDKFIDGMAVGSWELVAASEFTTAFFECSRSGNRRIVFGFCRFVVFCCRAILAASCAAVSVWSGKLASQLPQRRFRTTSRRISDQFLDAYDAGGGVVSSSGMAPQLRIAWRELHRPLRIGNPNA
jgi:hypothetical protein